MNNDLSASGIAQDLSGPIDALTLGVNMIASS
jgi:hypothetical protein